MIAAMKASIFSCAIVLTLALGALNAAYGASATWNLNPTSGDWTTAANWSNNVAPIAGADLVLLLEDGRIMERGMHRELVASSLRYRQLYELNVQQPALNSSS